MNNEEMINSWDTLPIGKFQKISQLAESENKEYEVIAILNDMTLEQVLDLPISKVNELAQNTAFLYEQPKKKRARKSYMLNGREYEVLLNMEEMTTAQYIDFKNFAPQCQEHLASFLTIFLIPKGKKYNSGYNIEFVANEINQYLNVEDALSLAAFFFKWCQKLIKRTLLYSEVALIMARMKAPKEQKEELKKAIQMVREMEKVTSTFGLDLWKQ